MKLKLDLHIHCLEALNIFNESHITKEIVGEIVTAVKKVGLDGIAITEHEGISCGQKVKNLVEQFYGNEILIIPGEEIPYYPVHIVQLFLPSGSVFRFLAHPGAPGDFTHFLSHNHDHIHGIEIENYLYDWHIDKEKVEKAAQQYKLLLLRNSDAHNLQDLGRHYIQINLEELKTRANKGKYVTSNLSWVFAINNNK